MYGNLFTNVCVVNGHTIKTLIELSIWTGRPEQTLRISRSIGFVTILACTSQNIVHFSESAIENQPSVTSKVHVYDCINDYWTSIPLQTAQPQNLMWPEEWQFFYDDGRVKLIKLESGFILWSLLVKCWHETILWMCWSRKNGVCYSTLPCLHWVTAFHRECRFDISLIVNLLTQKLRASYSYS